MKRTTIRLDNTIRNHIKNGINIIQMDNGEVKKVIVK